MRLWMVRRRQKWWKPELLIETGVYRLTLMRLSFDSGFVERVEDMISFEDCVGGVFTIVRYFVHFQAAEIGALTNWSIKVCILVFH